jgi:hypothetical protein
LACELTDACGKSQRAGSARDFFRRAGSSGSTSGKLPDATSFGRRRGRDCRLGWLARYLKEVDANEITVRFWQEIYDDAGRLVETHEKFPVDKGHQKV